MKCKDLLYRKEEVFLRRKQEIGAGSLETCVVRKINTAMYEIRFHGPMYQNIKYIMFWINFQEKWKLSDTEIKPGDNGPKKGFAPQKK